MRVFIPRPMTARPFDLLRLDRDDGLKERCPFCGHEWIAPTVGEYVKGPVHTNGIESFWALLKRGYYGTYHRMSPKHLQRYVNEFAGRHNVRPLDTIEQMQAIVVRMDRK